MEEGYRVKVSTYGTPKLEKGEVKPGGIKAAVCPQCGELSLSLAKDGA